jgi:hypothetical protein
MDLTRKVVAKKLKVTPPRVTQLVREMKKELGAIRRVGNNQVFTLEQVTILRGRKKTPGRAKGKG